MFNLRVHETLNSIGVLVSIALATATFWKQSEQAKENIVFSAKIENKDFESTIIQDNRGATLFTVKYTLLISNLSSSNASVVDAAAYSFINFGRHTDYMVASDPLDQPVNLNGHESKILPLNVRVSLSDKCAAALRPFGSKGSFLAIIKAIGEKPNCFTNIFEPYSQSEYDSTFNPKDNSSETTYYFLPPIIFQLKTATGTRHSADTSAFSVNFRGDDGKIMPR